MPDPTVDEILKPHIKALSPSEFDAYIRKISGSARFGDHAILLDAAKRLEPPGSKSDSDPKVTSRSTSSPEIEISMLSDGEFARHLRERYGV